MVVGHSADQTHKEEYAKSDQGEKCMKIIDVDRCLHAEECNYQVYLAKMKPVTCSPKNNFIVGVPVEKYRPCYSQWLSSDLFFAFFCNVECIYLFSNTVI